MKDIRLIEIFRTFTPEEIKAFKKFLHSPFLNSRRNLEPLLDYIISFHPEYDLSNLSKDKIYKSLFPREKFNEKKIVNLMFDLTKAAEDFLKHTELSKNEMESQLLLCRGYLDKKLYDRGLRTIRNLEEKLKYDNHISEDYFGNVHRLNRIKTLYYNGVNNYKQIYETANDILEASVIKFLRDYTWIMCDEEVAKIEFKYLKRKDHIIEDLYGKFDFKEVFKIKKKFGHRNQIFIDIYYYVLKTIKQPGKVEYYYSLKELFFREISKFEQEEKRLILYRLMNYAFYKMYAHMKDFKNEYIDLNKKMLDYEIYSLHESGYMDVMDFMNIINEVLNTDIKEAENFIEKYIKTIVPSSREDVRLLAFGDIYFKKKEYTTSLSYLSRVTPHWSAHHLTAKMIILLIYYELNYFDEAFILIDSYLHFLKNNKKLKDSFKKPDFQFLKFYTHLIKIKCGQSKENPLHVKLEIEKSTGVPYTNWLINNSDLLISKHYKGKKVV